MAETNDAAMDVRVRDLAQRIEQRQFKERQQSYLGLFPLLAMAVVAGFLVFVARQAQSDKQAAIGEAATLKTNLDRKSTRLNSSHTYQSRMPSSA